MSEDQGRDVADLMTAAAMRLSEAGGGDLPAGHVLEGVLPQEVKWWSMWDVFDTMVSQLRDEVVSGLFDGESDPLDVGPVLGLVASVEEYVRCKQDDMVERGYTDVHRWALLFGRVVMLRELLVHAEQTWARG